MTIEEFTSRLSGLRKVGNGYTARCPSHDDKNASLSVRDADDGRVLVKCHAGCETVAIVSALGLTMADLFAEKRRPRPKKPAARGRETESKFCIPLPDGTIAEHHRIDPADGEKKKNMWWTRNGAKGLGGLPVADLPLYGAELVPTWPADAPILVCEGEKAADACRRAGLNALATVTGAAATPSAPVLEVLRDHEVVLWPDSDEPGRSHMDRIAAGLSGVASRVRILTWGNEPGDDAFDFFARGGTQPELEGLIAAALEWKAIEVGPLLKILDDVSTFVSRYLVLTKYQLTLIVLWVQLTHALDAFDTTPYLNIFSPEALCGKTTLLEILTLLVARPWFTGRVTAAVLTRKVDAVKPTLLLDEGDAAFSGEKEYAEALRGLLNSGYKRSGTASACVGQGANIGFRDFSTFCPKAIAGIGDKLPDTVRSRSIPISLARKKPGEARKEYREREANAEAKPLREQLEKWATAHVVALRTARPEIPDGLYNRAKDVIEPLLAIADAAGGRWPEMARNAAQSLMARKDEDSSSNGTRVLADIREVFAEAGDRVPSAKLVAALNLIETSPWGDWNRGKGLTAIALARLLNPFGIAPRTVRFDDRTRSKGYLREHFDDAFERYLSPALPSPDNSTGDSVTTPENIGRSAPVEAVTPEPCHGEERSGSINQDSVCHDVTGQESGEDDDEIDFGELGEDQEAL